MMGKTGFWTPGKTKKKLPNWVIFTMIIAWALILYSFGYIKGYSACSEVALPPLKMCVEMIHSGGLCG